MAGVWILKGEVVQRGLTREAKISKQSKGRVATHSQCYRGPKAEDILCVATHSHGYRGPKAEGMPYGSMTFGRDGDSELVSSYYK